MGWRNRRVASTSMNRESSRSHAVFTMTVESKESINEVVNIRTSQLNLVDLAGSERQRDTQTDGSRLKVMLCPTTALPWIMLCSGFWVWHCLILFPLLSGGQQHQSLPYEPWSGDHGIGWCFQRKEQTYLLQGFQTHLLTKGQCPVPQMRCN